MREVKFKAYWNESKLMTSVDTIEFLEGGTRVSDGCVHTGWAGKDCELVEYTGLKDKNGVEIYEGDILKAIDGYTGLIGCRTESAQFVGFNIGNEFTEEEFDTLYTVNGSFNSAEVIGNHFENHELLKNGI